MIVNVHYTVEKTIALEVDDKYAKIEDLHLPWGQWGELRRELWQNVQQNKAIPEDAELTKIVNKEHTYTLATAEDGY